MAYTSPLHIVNHFNSEAAPGEEIDLGRLQKKILAEFNLVRTVVININGAEYSKDSVLKLMDGLRNDHLFPAHQAIFNVPAVLSFLETPNARPDINVILLFFKFNKEAPHYNFLLGLLNQALQEHLRNCLASHKYDIFRETFFLCEELLPEQLPQFNELIYRHLRNLQAQITSFEESIRSDYHLDAHVKKALNFIGEGPFEDFLNALPWEFDEVILEFVSTLFQFIQLSYDHKAVSKDFLFYLYSTLTRIKRISSNMGMRLFHYTNMLKERISHGTDLRLLHHTKMLKEEMQALEFASPPEEYVPRRWDKLSNRASILKIWLVVMLLFLISFFMGDHKMTQQILLTVASCLFFVSLVFAFSNSEKS